MPMRWYDEYFFFEGLRFERPLGMADRINELIHDLVSNSELLFAVDSREFELLVAEILRRKGYDVEVTRQSRDDGIDIYASRIEPSGLRGLYLVQCKRQSRTNRVGVRPVRELYGVVCARNATGGIVITTSFFTSPAMKFQSAVPNRIALQDNGHVLRWLLETAARPTK
jgi:restriction system protein